MDDTGQDYQSDESPTNVPAAPPRAPTTSDSDVAQPDAARAALVKEWVSRIKDAKTKHEKAFKRMRTNMDMARDGATKAWVKDEDRYVAPILNRHINTQVAMLYAKNPTPLASRKKRMMATVWDGKKQSLDEAQQIAMQSAQMMGMPDPNAMAIIQDAIQVREYDRMVEKLGKTLEYMWNYYMDEQSSNYKQMFKALVRRTKVTGVGYVKLGFQRILKPRPDIVAKIDDCTAQIATLQRLQDELQEGEIEENSARLDDLMNLMKQLDQQQMLIAREGPVLDFPRSTEIIVDPSCRHLKTLTGARWWAQEFDMTPDQIDETYDVDVGDQMTAYNQPAGVAKEDAADVKTGKVWLVQDRKLQQEFVLCDGYPDFIVPPADPDVKIERFFTLFPLVFNEIEHEEDLFPPSDIQLARHAQNAYNVAREGLREHRKQNRPAYFAPRGKLQEEDLKKVANHASGEVIELDGMSPGDRVMDMLQPKPAMPIDPALYDVEAVYADLLRSVGTSEANLGQPGDATATASSIAESSRQTTVADNVDDLDEMLSDITKAMGQLMLLEISKETVLEIVGPGAVWPDMPASREDIAKDLMLDIKAGSSGRPNKALLLSNLERSMPYVMQLPGVNPVPFVEKICELNEVDLEDALVEGLPSITAINAMMGKMGMQPGTGDPRTDPNSQGPQGSQNAQDQTQTNDGQQQMNPAPAAVGGDAMSTVA